MTTTTNFNTPALAAAGVPADQARRRSALADLEDQGIAVPAEGSPGPSTAQELLRRYVQAADASQVPIETSILLGEGLSKKFPAARGPDLLDAVELLFPCWARFDDWMGAIALLRALPVQRQLPLSAFARSANVWLGTQEDLFDAVRDFTRLEEAGKRSASQVLDLLMFGEVRL